MFVEPPAEFNIKLLSWKRCHQDTWHIFFSEEMIIFPTPVSSGSWLFADAVQISGRDLSVVIVNKRSCPILASFPRPLSTNKQTSPWAGNQGGQSSFCLGITFWLSLIGIYPKPFYSIFQSTSFAQAETHPYHGESNYTQEAGRRLGAHSRQGEERCKLVLKGGKG